jgi:succinate dehydrogenase / fumarate reductase cytochrome b subunit
MQQKEFKSKYPMPLSPRVTIYKWRAPMIASLAHRASGMVLVLFVPFYLWVLHGMTGGPEDFEQAVALLHSPFGSLTLWMAGTAFIYHFCNGIRFLMLDAGWGESHAMLRLSARFVIAVAAVTAVVLGWVLWL